MLPYFRLLAELGMEAAGRHPVYARNHSQSSLFAFGPPTCALPDTGPVSLFPTQSSPMIPLKTGQHSSNLRDCVQYARLSDRRLSGWPACATSSTPVCDYAGFYQSWCDFSRKCGPGGRTGASVIQPPVLAFSLFDSSRVRRGQGALHE